MYRKVALLLIACLIQGITCERRGVPSDLVQCGRKENVPYNALLSYGYDRMPTVAETESLPNYKCFFTCLVETANLINGCTINFSPEVGSSPAGARRRHTTLQLCKDAVKGTERCECGYELYKCVTDIFSKDMSKESEV